MSLIPHLAGIQSEVCQQQNLDVMPYTCNLNIQAESEGLSQFTTSWFALEILGKPGLYVKILSKNFLEIVLVTIMHKGYYVIFGLIDILPYNHI